MRVGRHIAFVLGFCALVLLLASPGAGAQSTQRSEPGVGELWEQFPLEDGRPPADAGNGASSDADGRVTPQPSGTAAPARREPAAEEGSGWMWVVLAIAALVVVDILVFLRVRSNRARRRREAAAPAWGQGSNVYAEGSTDRDGIGAFRGFVYAMGSGSEPAGDRMLCVHDPGHDEPVWVRRSEVTSLSGRGPSVPADAAEGSAAKPTARASSA